MDYREQFQKEPLVWSLGALSAGFALGYTVGYAHKISRGKHSQLAQFTDRMINEISHVGEKLVMPALSFKIKDFFGFDFSEMLRDMGGQRKPLKRSSRPKRRALKSSAKRSRQRRKKK